MAITMKTEKGSVMIFIQIKSGCGRRNTRRHRNTTRDWNQIECFHTIMLEVKS